MPARGVFSARYEGIPRDVVLAVLRHFRFSSTFLFERDVLSKSQEMFFFVVVQLHWRSAEKIMLARKCVHATRVVIGRLLRLIHVGRGGVEGRRMMYFFLIAYYHEQRGTLGKTRPARDGRCPTYMSLLPPFSKTATSKRHTKKKRDTMQQSARDMPRLVAACSRKATKKIAFRHRRNMS